MDFTSGQYTQLIVGLFAVVLMFMYSYMGNETRVIQLLMYLIPFQPVVSKYGSVNTGLALLVMAGFILNKRVSRFPLFSIVLLALFVYLISTALSIRETYKDHFFYIVTIAANVSIFYIIFNYVYRTGKLREAFNMFFWTNVLVVVYSIIQLKVGYGTLSIMGVEDLSLTQNREDARLSGPFNAVGITAEYMVLQSYMLMYMYFHESHTRRKILILAVILANLGVLVATGNRGGLLVLILAAGLFFLLFKHEFGVRRLIKIGAAGFVMFVISATIIVTFTEFNVLFERLSETTVDEGIPDSRAKIWPLAVERIQENPVFGHGPRIRLIDENLRIIIGHQFMPYPHSLYLFVLYTLGIVGLMVLSLAFVSLLLLFLRRAGNNNEDPFVRGIPKLAVLLLVIIAVDQIKVSMLRFILSDFQQYISALLGMMVAGSYMASLKKSDVAINAPYKSI